MVFQRIRQPVMAVLTLLALVQTSTSADDEKDSADAVRKALARLAQAFNKHDAVAVAAVWAEDAVYTDPATGLQLTGREAIRAHYATLFEGGAELKLAAKISDIDIDGDARAFVRGTAEVTSKEGEATATSFLAELIREGEQWLLTSVEEADPDLLQDLDWLVGAWQDEGDGPSIRSTITWDPGGHFLVRSYSITDESGGQRTGTQYIAYDAAVGRIHSWVFDSEGDVGQGKWSQHDDHWAIHWSVTLADGRKASATQTVKPIDEDSFQVQWTDVDVDGQLRPSKEPVTVKRVVAVRDAKGGANNE